MFVLELKEEERKINNVTNNLRYDLPESIFISPSKILLKIILLGSTTTNWTFKTNFGGFLNQEWLSSHKLTDELNLNSNPLDLNTIIMKNCFSHNHDRLPNQYMLWEILNLTQPPYPRTAQTITNIFKISFSQHNFFHELKL